MFEGLNLSPILIPLATLLVGWVIGFFDSNMRTAKKIKQAEDLAQAAIKDAEDKIAEIRAKSDTVEATPVTPDDLGLMRIKNESGKMTLDLDGTRVDTSALSVEQRKRLIEMLNVMRPWLEGKPVSVPSPAPVPASANPPTHQAVAYQASDTQPVSPQNDANQEAAPASIVGQINTILQSQIANSPLASRGVTLLESPLGGVSVYVGVNKYDGVDAIPDEEVKSAIRTAIAEWEKKYTPGL
jgi:hypothetical protein